MKKNKTMAYALAASLLVGGTFVGTKALFQDEVDVVGELSISTGDLDIAITEQTEWDLVRNGGEESNTGTKNPNGTEATYDNLKHGDELTKTVKVKNQGTLKAVVTFEENESVTNKLPEGIEYTATFTDNKGETIESGSVLAPEAEGTIKFVLKVVGTGKHGEGINSNEQEDDIITLTNSYKLEAKQTGGQK